MIQRSRAGADMWASWISHTSSHPERECLNNIPVKVIHYKICKAGIPHSIQASLIGRIRQIFACNADMCSIAQSPCLNLCTILLLLRLFRDWGNPREIESPAVIRSQNRSNKGLQCYHINVIWSVVTCVCVRACASLYVSILSVCQCISVYVYFCMCLPICVSACLCVSVLASPALTLSRYACLCLHVFLYMSLYLCALATFSCLFKPYSIPLYSFTPWTKGTHDHFATLCKYSKCSVS
jgi:hypothetical protein